MNTLIRLLVGVIIFNPFPCHGQGDVFFPKQSWQESTPEREGVDGQILHLALQYLESQSYGDKNDEFLIIRNGRIIYKGPHVTRTHNIYSCSKGFTSLVFGLLLDEGRLKIDDKVSEVLIDMEQFYPDVTWAHFATMTSGYSAIGLSRWEEENADWSWTPYNPEPPHFPPGSHFEYWDEAQMMFGKGLTEVLGKSMQEYLDEKIMQKIDFGNWEWGKEQQTSAGVPINNGCTGVTINALQLARFGYLFLNDGNWSGEQLISREFVRKATSVQVDYSLPVFEGERSNVKGSGSYGFNWWANSDNGLSNLPNAPLGTAYLSGLNHNMCFIIPEWDMVIVRMGDDKNPDLPKNKVWDRFFEILKPGLQNVSN